MTKRKGGMRRKTRYKLRKAPRQKGKVSLTRYFQQFTQGQQVILHLEPSIHKGMFLPRFHGKTGTIKEKQGACYTVAIVDGNKPKTLLVHPVHLKRT